MDACTAACALPRLQAWLACNANSGCTVGRRICRCVRFSHDDRRLFSVGGIDRCVFQWRTVGICAKDQHVDQYLLRALEEAALRKHQVGCCDFLAADEHPHGMLRPMQMLRYRPGRVCTRILGLHQHICVQCTVQQHLVQPRPSPLQQQQQPHWAACVVACMSALLTTLYASRC